MKTLRAKIAKLALLFVTLTLTMSFTTKRACADYYIDNSAFPNCVVDFDITITDLPGCTTCLGPVPMQVAGGSVLRLPCGTCINQCNITLSVTAINGAAVTAGAVDFVTTSATISGGVFPCNGVSSISFAGGTFTIL